MLGLREKGRLRLWFGEQQRRAMLVMLLDCVVPLDVTALGTGVGQVGEALPGPGLNPGSGA